ncbi:phosphatase PAP2 family protein [Streptomyces iconiensis]|uniref:Phosphatase PAP2 family protein n=1 Tax=Streptomyces iconiensis TaxID=1384038 RepID=A0ABT7A7M3_9ACTN|nr:phosphatase PAP2 family protein [Streptomyces iconiensis]MDJ1137320.1 phosphatase PAP2 family protein [Streptomyces iconiensis]
MATDPAPLDPAPATATTPGSTPGTAPAPASARAHPRQAPRPVTLGLALFASLAVFALFAGLVLARNAGFIDRPVLSEAVAHRVALLDGPMTVVTHASKYPLLIVTALGAAFVSLRRRSWRPLLLVGGTGALSVAVATLAKETTDRARPPALFWAIPEDGWCFPSRHTVIATAVLLMLAYVFSARLASRAARLALWAGALALSALVGASRVYLGVHWATDALAGLALGATVMLAVTMADVLLRGRRRA